MTPSVWIESLGRIELEIPHHLAAIASHQGRCDESVRAVSERPVIKAQLDALDPKLVAECLKEYGAWSADELTDHPQNLQRLLWCACNDIIGGH